MARILIKRGLETNRSGITPSSGELIWTTDNKDLWIGDGSTSGGIKITANVENNLNTNYYTKSQIDGLIDSNLKNPDGYTTNSSNTYPSDYMSSGEVNAGDIFYITDTSNGNLVGTTPINVGDMLIAKVDNPGNTDSNWLILESNREQATESVLGMVEIATTSEVSTGTNDSTAVTPLKLKQELLSANTAEIIEDVAGDMFNSNTEAGIVVTYDDSTGKINLDVADFVFTLDGAVQGNVTVTNLGNATLNTSIPTIEDIDDVTSGMTKANNDVLVWNSSSSKWENASAGSIGRTNFIALDDTPANYSSSANKLVSVNSAGDSLVFIDTINGGTF